MKVLIFQRVILPYRIPFFNELASRVDLTVAYYMYDKSGDGCLFEKIKVPFCKIGPMHIQKGVRRLAKKFDVVFIGTDLHAIGYISLPFFPHKYHILSWGIGFRASHKHPFLVNRKHGFLDRVTETVLSKCEANVFYMPQVKHFWKSSRLDAARMFVAPNTVEVSPAFFDANKKKNIIFVGTLYKGKGVDALLYAVNEANRKVNAAFMVDIVGDGPYRQELESISVQLGLTDIVTFHGAVFDSKKLSEFYSNALCCVSPFQAGLSVCTSMGNGVPFVTRASAITGGEIFHITNGVNGVLYQNDDALADIIVDVIDNPSSYIEMGVKAREYYENNATIQHMVEGFVSAIQYATGIKV